LGIGDTRTVIQKKPIPGPGSRGQKGNGSWIPDLEHWREETRITKKYTKKRQESVSEKNVKRKQIQDQHTRIRVKKGWSFSARKGFLTKEV
jgi:hypothetical protein